MCGFRRAALVLCTFMVMACSHGDVLEQDIFRIEYHKADFALARESLPVLMEARDEYQPVLPAGSAPIRMLIAFSLPEFSAYAHTILLSNVTGFARPSENLIVVKSPHIVSSGGSEYRDTLRHELVHVLLYRNTNADHLPRWLNEGIAMDLAGNADWNTTLQISHIFLNGRIIEYRDLDFVFSSPSDDVIFGQAYVQGYSMTRFLKRKLGNDEFWAMVRDCRTMFFDDALYAHAHLKPLELWYQWRRSLWLVAFLGIIMSGSMFGPMAVLVVIAFYRKKMENRRILRRWAVEEAEDDVENIQVFNWDDVVDGPYEWEQQDDE